MRRATLICHVRLLYVRGSRNTPPTLVPLKSGWALAWHASPSTRLRMCALAWPASPSTSSACAHWPGLLGPPPHDVRLAWPLAPPPRLRGWGLAWPASPSTRLRRCALDRNSCKLQAKSAPLTTQQATSHPPPSFSQHHHRPASIHPCRSARLCTGLCKVV